MCGIVAVWNRDGAPVDLDALERSVGSMSRRGPDDEGYLLVDTRTGRSIQCRGRASDHRVDLPPLAAARDHPFDLALGHRRLSIVDLSPAGHQPMATRQGTLWIVFNGMIHNFLDLRQELTGKGYEFRSRTDTEAILHAYDEWGPGCVDRFNGMWAFVIWDGRRQQLFASRDRLGIKPLLSAAVGPVAAFASEVRALRPFPGIPTDIDPEAVHHYLSLMKVPAPFTIYRGIRKTLPGHSVTVQRDSVAATAYWRLEPAATPVRDEADAVSRLDALLTDSVRLRLIADVPMGTLLSAGVDSGLVTAIAARSLPPGALNTFSLSFPDEPEIDEGPGAERMAAHLGTSHHTIQLSVEFLDGLPQLVGLFDEPFAVSSALGVFRLAQEASRRSKVLLTGDGGDEIFAGYLHRHQRVDQIWDAIDRRRLSRFRAPRAEAAAEAVRWREPSLADRLAVRLRGVALSRQRARDLSFNARRALFSEPEKRALYTPAWRAATRGTNTLEWLCATLPAPDGDRLTRWQVHDVRTSLHDEMLTKVDRATMACSVEARPPILDHRLVELAVNLPASLKLRDGEGKWILKKLAERYMPATALHGLKQGFTMPLSRWIQREWRDLVGDALGAGAVRRVGVFEPRAVADVLAHHATHPDFTTAHMVYTLLCFQVWHAVVHEA